MNTATIAEICEIPLITSKVYNIIVKLSKKYSRMFHEDYRDWLHDALTHILTIKESGLISEDVESPYYVKATLNLFIDKCRQRAKRIFVNIYDFENELFDTSSQRMIERFEIEYEREQLIKKVVFKDKKYFDIVIAFVRGCTIKELSSKFNYSERQIYRILKKVREEIKNV